MQNPISHFMGKLVFFIKLGGGAIRKVEFNE